MRSFSLIPNNAAGAAVRRAVAQIDQTGLACERPIRIEGDYLLWADSVHHSAMLIMALLVGMTTDTPDNMDQWRIPQVIDKIAGQDENQETIMLRLSPAPASTTLYDCIKTIIKAESLEQYFEEEQREEDDPKNWHQAIRPVRYRAAQRAAMGEGDEIDVFAELKRQAQAERMEPMRRIALVAILSIYNAETTGEYFKGRGWNFHAAELGAYCASRIEAKPDAFDALIHAFVVYPGW